MTRPRGHPLLLAAMLGAQAICCASGKPALGAVGSDPAAKIDSKADAKTETAKAEAAKDHARLLPAGDKSIAGELQTLEGKKVQLAELRGHPALLDFFATWCEPCRVGLPRTDAIVQAHAALGLAGWAVSIDEELAPVAPFAAKLGLKLPVRWDSGGKTADALGVQLLPALLLVDATGAIRYRANADDPDFDRHLDEAVELLLAESAKK